MRDAGWGGAAHFTDTFSDVPWVDEASVTGRSHEAISSVIANKQTLIYLRLQ